MNSRKILITVFILMAGYSLFAGGAIDLSKPQPDEGILVIMTMAYPGTVSLWTRTLIFQHAESGEEFKIPFGDDDEIRTIRLPAGNYSFLRTVSYKEGTLDSELTKKSPSHNYNFTDFTVSEGVIQPLPFFLYYFNTKADSHEEARMTSMPEETQGWSLYKGSTGTDNIWRWAAYSLNAYSEAKIYKALSSEDDFDQWAYESAYHPAPVQEEAVKIVSVGSPAYPGDPLSLVYASSSARIFPNL